MASQGTTTKPKHGAAAAPQAPGLCTQGFRGSSAQTGRGEGRPPPQLVASSPGLAPVAGHGDRKQEVAKGSCGHSGQEAAPVHSTPAPLPLPLRPAGRRCL